MSTTYHLACTTCKEVIWIGQSTNMESSYTGKAYWFLYTSEESTMKVFHEFLRQHQSDVVDLDSPYGHKHALVFIDDNLDLDDYTVIDYDGRKHRWGV